MINEKIRIDLLDENKYIDYAHKFYNSKSGRVVCNDSYVYHIISPNKIFYKVSNVYFWLSFLFPRGLMINDGVLFWKESNRGNAVEIAYAKTRKNAPLSIINRLEDQVKVIATIKRKPLLTEIVNEKITPKMMEYKNWSRLNSKWYIKNIN